jgi:hypothetical protein
MKRKFLIFLFFLAIVHNQPITASLTLVQYEPYIFELKFS